MTHHVKGSHVIVIVLLSVVVFCIGFGWLLYTMCSRLARIEIMYRLKAQEDPDSAAAKPASAQAGAAQA
jgi:hypothetical protein